MNIQSASQAKVSASINYRLLRIASEKFGKPPAALDSGEEKTVKNIAAREYLIEQAVLASPDAQQVVVPDSQVHKAAEQIADRYDDEEAFVTALGENGLTPQTLKQALERELRVESVLARIGSRAPRIDDTEVDLFYYMNRAKFDRPERRAVRHILITVNPEFVENTLASATHRINLIYRRIQKNPERFAEQALKHSECPTALQGGVLGNVKAGELYPELDKALFAMQAGDFSEPIATEVGLHILWCEAIYEAGIPNLEEVYQQLKIQLQDKQDNRFIRNWIQQLLQSTAIEDKAETNNSVVVNEQAG